MDSPDSAVLYLLPIIEVLHYNNETCLPKQEREAEPSSQYVATVIGSATTSTAAACSATMSAAVAGPSGKSGAAAGSASVVASLLVSDLFDVLVFIPVCHSLLPVCCIQIAVFTL